MIIRIATEGQYRVGSQALDKLNDIDNQIVDVVARNDEASFTVLLNSLLEVIRQEGKPVEMKEIVESDLVLPAPDTTLEEARHLFQGEGLFPD